MLTEDEDGIVDPYGMPIESYERCAQEIEDALIPLVKEAKRINDQEDNK